MSKCPKHSMVAGEVELEIHESDTNLTSTWGAHVRGRALGIQSFAWLERVTLDFDALKGRVSMHVLVDGVGQCLTFSVAGSGRGLAAVTCPHPSVTFGQPQLVSDDRAPRDAGFYLIQDPSEVTSGQ